MVNKSKNNRKLRFVFFYTFYLLFVYCTSKHWQGYGNMSSSNLTEIYDFINGNLGAAINDGSDAKLQQFTTDFSTKLNLLWAPAWNIMMVELNDP